ncbi:PREDICTED: 187-kDa microtubule-associated protein AIR9 [Fragaria vesca subsp. vesca]|uniref:187-kDa microtubule-associated protein AIR9 n=1 Tax=Fragaria vesca subsp. vesca TaxID=101020 RepID=UPI0002C373A1|nr:PREDICTED: 187-kDa microtubule-associated protein AIR9 [Fragaria vesca subsp. vesca]XP_011460652.1 PREDICTED: 187-kDa microtubule-associated protein AIR9 [Fragaria vesca subsp. vesca]XP_011460653.1 PREDICTED: 187-kDa microtubule-associated protein AIR9 [Fragaria vesca subsp. vesca]
MEDNVEPPGKDPVESPQVSEKQASLGSSEAAKRVAKTVKPGAGVTSKGSVPISSVQKKVEAKSGLDSSSSATKSSATGASRSSSSVPVVRRNSTGALPPSVSAGRQQGNATPIVGNKSADPIRRSLPELRRSSLPSVVTKSTSVSQAVKLSAGSPLDRSLNKSSGSLVRKPSVKPASSVSSSSSRMTTSSLDSSASSGVRKSVSKLSSSSARSPTVTSGLRSGSLSSSMNSSTSLSGRRKAATPESRKAATPEGRDSRFIVLPKVEIKAGDDLRLDLRGHRVRSLKASGLNLSPNLEFVYLRDNLLSTLEGVEILTRVKVLDLSFNDFKGPGFEPLENCRVLQQLYLAGNQITSLASLPQLPNLEFLSVAQNKLKSLTMASQPRLQVLAASKNKISTLKGFPYLPVLEHLRVEENPILKMRNLEAASILLAGPTLKKFNDRDLSREQVAIAKRYPAHTSLCIREGWEFCRPEHAADSTFSFLVEQWKDNLPPGFLVKEAFIDQPFEEDTCRCHFTFVQESTSVTDPQLIYKYQWFVGERTPSNFTSIPDATGEVYWPKHEDVGKILKVECTPILGEMEYPPIFAISSLVKPGTGTPKVVNLDVHGELVEGNTLRGHAEIAWCGGTPAKGVSSWLRRKWNSSPVVIAGAEDEEYKLTIDDIGTSLVFMYTPVTEEGAKGEPHYKYTDFVKSAPPSVSNVQILGDLVEGSTIRGIGDYFGGREGPSKFEWLCERSNTGDFVLVSTGTSEYTLSKEDVGHRLAFAYIPINFEGQEGESVSVLSDVVKQAPPKVLNLKIIGDMRENSKVTASGVVTGGTEGSSRVQWFKTSFSTVVGEKGLEALSTSKIAKAFRIPLGAVGYYIVAKFTPMTPDGESGDPAYVISDTTVETLPPSLNFLSITGDYSEGGILTGSYGYIGGHEGKSIYNWYIHEVETDAGSLIPEVTGLLQYRITKNAIGKFISFQCTPVRDDGIVGEPTTCMGQERIRPGSPRLLSLRIVGDATEGTSLTVDKQYWGGEEGNSLFYWFRSTSDGTPAEIRGATTASYTLSIDDIGFFISVSCEPVRSDWARGPTVLSEQIGPIIPGPPTCHSLEFLGSMIEGQRLSFNASYSGGEKGNCFHEWFRVKSNGVKEKLSTHDFLDLTLDDVGKCIELVYTPMRKDGMRGNPKSIKSDVVEPADPEGLELMIPDCCEDEELVPEKTYFGGEEGVGEYIWYRTKNKLHGSALLDISNLNEDVGICGKTLTYKPALEDVGAYLALYWVPTRKDGKCGKALVAVCNSPVAPALPVVSNVRVKEVSLSVYSGEGEYFGGYEGWSLFSWYRETNEGTISLINGANSRTYEVTDADYNCRLLFGYTPVRSDSVVGELRLSEPTDIILPELPRLEMLALTGKAIEGDVLTVVEVIPESLTQQLVWHKYKQDVRYQWFVSSAVGDDKTFEPLPAQRSCSYRMRLEDVGRSLKCECIVTDVFGRSAEPAYAETGPILPGIPRIDKLEIEGRGFHTNLYAVRGVYSGGKEGKSKIQWLRSMVGSPDLISIPGEVGRMYESNVDDVGYRLVAIYTPVREDGVEGQPVSASTEPITVEPDVLKEVKQKLDLGSVKFEVLCDKDQSTKKTTAVGTLERRTLEVNRKRVKVIKPGSKTSFPTTEIRGTYAPPFHVELFRNDQHRLRIVVDSESEVDLMVQSRHLRDVIVLVIRGFAQRFNSTSLNTLLKIEHNM